MKGFAAIVSAVLLLSTPAVLRPAAGPVPALEVVATGVPRPLQVVGDGRRLIVLSPGTRGDAAGELYTIDLDGALPADLSRQPHQTIAFVDQRTATLGSLAMHPTTRELYAGEENGGRIYRVVDGALALYATGLHRLAGGGTLAFDAAGRLVVVDHVDPALSESEERAPPGLEQLRDEDYRGPLVFRLTLDPGLPLPRRLGRVAPLFPRGWGGKTGGAHLPWLISAAPIGGSDLAFLTASGEVYRLGAGGGFGLFALLPRGQYNRTHMIGAPDGSILVSGGFHVGRVFRVGADGAVSVLAENLADPEGIALDDRGQIYVAESSLHRIVRLAR